MPCGWHAGWGCLCLNGPPNKPCPVWGGAFFKRHGMSGRACHGLVLSLGRSGGLSWLFGRCGSSGSGLSGSGLSGSGPLALSPPWLCLPWLCPPWLCLPWLCPPWLCPLWLCLPWLRSLRPSVPPGLGLSGFPVSGVVWTAFFLWCASLGKEKAGWPDFSLKVPVQPPITYAYGG